MDKINIYLAIGTLILGWILAILGNVINEKLKRKSNKRDIRVGIKTEILELQIHLTAVCLKSVTLIGKFTKEYFLWIKPYFIKFFQSAEFIIPKEIRDTLPSINELDDEMLFNLINITFVKNATTNPATTFTYQTIITPYIDLKLNDISLFNTSIQKSIFSLKRDINFLNSDVNQIWFYHSKTFDNTTEENLELLKANLNIQYAKISRRSKIMVENIEGILKELNK